jgi:hypothetical protein
MISAQSSEPDAQSSTPPEAPAQQSAPAAQPPATGSITGHVILGDSHLPARMAFVTLLPFTAAEAGNAKPVVSTATVQTGLDGAYVMPNILPGAYYVIAVKLGYVSPIPFIYVEPDAYDDAPKDVKEALAAALTPVAVAANRTSTSDIVLNKGAIISGTVRFDDGEPDSQTVVSLLHKDKSGKWTEFATQEALYSSGARTDDQGNFRLTGLPAGEYLLRTTLKLEGRTTVGTSISVTASVRVTRSPSSSKTARNPTATTSRYPSPGSTPSRELSSASKPVTPSTAPTLNCITPTTTPPAR